jgi:hypothetical protein
MTAPLPPPLPVPVLRFAAGTGAQGGGAVRTGYDAVGGLQHLPAAAPAAAGQAAAAVMRAAARADQLDAGRLGSAGRAAPENVRAGPGAAKAAAAAGSPSRRSVAGAGAKRSAGMPNIMAAFSRAAANQAAEAQRVAAEIDAVCASVSASQGSGSQASHGAGGHAPPRIAMPPATERAQRAS